MKTTLLQFLATLPLVFPPALRAGTPPETPTDPAARSRVVIVRNPDAPPPFWALSHDGQPLLRTTTLKSVDDSFTFVPRFHPLVATPAGHTAQATIPEPPAIRARRNKLPISNGFDDPREINAYLLGQILHVDLLDDAPDEFSPEQLATLAEERRHLPELLRLCPTDTHPN